MQIGDKVTVIRNPKSKTREEMRRVNMARTEQRGILESTSSNVIVVKYKNYRESFNIAELIEGRVEIQDKHHTKLTVEEFRKMM